MVDINGYDFQQKYWISPEAYHELYSSYDIIIIDFEKIS